MNHNGQERPGDPVSWHDHCNQSKPVDLDGDKRHSHMVRKDIKCICYMGYGLSEPTGIRSFRCLQ